MERLTKYSEINKDYITPHCDNFNCNGCCRDCDYEQVIINKLAEYENTGLEPKEVEQLKHDLAVRDKALKFAVADKIIFEDFWAEQCLGSGAKITPRKKEQYYLDQAEKELKGERIIEIAKRLKELKGESDE